MAFLTVHSQAPAYLGSDPAPVGCKNSFPYTLPCFQTHMEIGVPIKNASRSHHTLHFEGKAKAIASEPFAVMIRRIDNHDYVIMAQVFNASVADFI